MGILHRWMGQSHHAGKPHPQEPTLPAQPAEDHEDRNEGDRHAALPISSGSFVDCCDLLVLILTVMCIALIYY